MGPPPGLINALVLGIFYGYFAMGFDGDSDVCYANDSDDNRLQDDAKPDVDAHYTNVGAVYHFAFKTLFFMTLIEFTISFFAYSISK